MKRLYQKVRLAAGLLLAWPVIAWADFSFGEVPQYFQDQAPNWLFQILSAILLGFVELLSSMLFGTAAA